MRRITILSLTIVIALVVAGLVVPVVFAKKGGGGNARFSDKLFGWSSDSLVSEGGIVGLANADYLVRLRAIGYADATCVSPGGNEEVKGRNPVYVEVDEEAVVPTAKNGRASFTLKVEASADISPSPTPKEAGCPNGNWTVILDPVNWTEAWLYLYVTDGTPPVLVDEAHFECDINEPGLCTLAE